MKKTIVITSLFSVCILMALPLTSVAESSNMPDKKISRLRTMLMDEIATINNLKENKQELTIGCLMLLILLILCLPFTILYGIILNLPVEEFDPEA